jgi:hypothetical protein
MALFDGQNDDAHYLMAHSFKIYVYGLLIFARFLLFYCVYDAADLFSLLVLRRFLREDTK